MSLLINHCSNPDCHRPFRKFGYTEAIALLQLGEGMLEYRIFSVCQICKNSLSDTIVLKTILDIIEYETDEKKSSASITRRELDNWIAKYTELKVINWANSRIELDEKMAIIG